MTNLALMGAAGLQIEGACTFSARKIMEVWRGVRKMSEFYIVFTDFCPIKETADPPAPRHPHST